MRPHEHRAFDKTLETIMRLVTMLGLAAITAFGPAVQSTSGRWSAVPQPGTTITLDLSVAGAVVTGSMTVTQQDGGSVIGSIEQAAINGATFSLKVQMGDQIVAFVGELNGDELRLRSVDHPQAAALVLRRESVSPPSPAAAVTTPAGWRSTT